MKLSRLALRLSASIAVAPLIVIGCTSGDGGGGAPAASDAATDSGVVADATDATIIDSALDAEDAENSGDSGAGDGADVDVPDGATDSAGLDAAYVRPDAIVVPPLPTFDPAVLPKDATGRPTLAQGTGLRIVLDGSTRGPTNVLAGCSALISGCYQPGVRTLDACVVSMPTCATAKPWEETSPCCPAACIDRYETLRLAGTPPQAAAYTMLFKGPRCIPGLDAALGGKP